MRILDLLYPPVCPLCGNTIRRSCDSFPLCKACGGEAQALQIRAAQELQNVLPEVTELYCAYRYTGTLRDAVLQYKYHGEIWMAEPFAELLYRRIRDGGGAGLFEIMTYVPVSGKRFAARGYDQTLEIVKRLHIKSGIPYTKCFVKKDAAGDNAAEKKNRTERNQESRYVYAGRETEIRNKAVLLADDILTTGSTLRECTRLLLEHGAGCVFAAVLASGRKDL